LNSAEWGNDLEVQLLAIGLQRDIVVINSGSIGSYVRFPHEAPPLPKMSGGTFMSLTYKELCTQWLPMIPFPLVIIFNGSN